MARPAYRYKVLVDGNNQFMVTKERNQPLLSRLLFGQWNPPLYAHASYYWEDTSRRGLNPSPTPTKVLRENGYEWKLRDFQNRTKDWLFPDAAEAMKALHWLREKDRQKLQADEVISVMEETL